MKISKIWFPAFEGLFVCGEISNDDVAEIIAIRSTIFYDVYAGYSKTEQNKRKQIVDFVKSKGYEIVEIIEL